MDWLRRLMWPHGFLCLLLGCKYPYWHFARGYPTYDEYKAIRDGG